MLCLVWLLLAEFGCGAATCFRARLLLDVAVFCGGVTGWDFEEETG